MQGDINDQSELLETYIDRLNIHSRIELISTEDSTWAYKVILTRGSQSIELDYEDFDEHSDAIVAQFALDEAASDAACIECTPNLWEWCQAYYGLEPHNPIIPDPEESYLIQRSKASKLKEFLGTDEYETLLFKVERINANEE
jgi:hypothetical protein